MSPAKRKTVKKKKKSVPNRHRKRAPKEAPLSLPAPAPPAPLVPPPVLTVQQKKWWKVVPKNLTRNLIGASMFLMGVAFALGYIASDKAHLHEKVALYAAGVFMLFGAHFMSSEPTERALRALGRTAGAIMPGNRANGNTAETKAAGGGDGPP